MGVMDKVIIHHSNVYDFLAGMYRLKNNDKVIEVRKELGLEEKVKFNDDIQRWVDVSRDKMTHEVSEWLDLFFNYESFFGLCLLKTIAENDLKDINDFMGYLKGLSCADILKRFLETGYSNTVSREQIDKMLEDNKIAVSYIEKNVSMPPKQKWELLQFFLDPDGMKEKLLKLIEWSYNNIFKEKIKIAEEVVMKQEKELEKKLRMYGEDYLKLLLDIECSKHAITKPVVIAFSYYFEISSSNFYGDDAAMDFHLIGYRHPELLVEGKHALLSNVNMFKSLADETRLNIIKLLCQRPWYGNELAQELKLSNSTISYHLSMLSLSGFVEAEREDNRFYFRADMEKIKKGLCDSLDNMMR